MHIFPDAETDIVYFSVDLLAMQQLTYIL